MQSQINLTGEQSSEEDVALIKRVMDAAPPFRLERIHSGNFPPTEVLIAEIARLKEENRLLRDEGQALRERIYGGQR